MIPAGVLFDMDGTLIDSEKLWEIGLRELAASYGGVLSAEARARMVGTTSEESMRILHADVGQPGLDPVRSGLWLDTRVTELYAGGFDWRPGARELLAAVRAAGWPTGLVTATRRGIVEQVLPALGRHNFDVVVCGDDVARGKPDPLPYLTAAQALGADPSACVAIEDSPTGAASAFAAGCAVVAVPHDAPVDNVDIYWVVPSLLEVDLNLLADLATRRRSPAGR